METPRPLVMPSRYAQTRPIRVSLESVDPLIGLYYLLHQKQRTKLDAGVVSVHIMVPYFIIYHPLSQAYQMSLSLLEQYLV